MTFRTMTPTRTLLLAAALAGMVASAPGQVPISSKFMTVGNLHGWFSSAGCEIEEGRVLVQQDGLQWPGIYLYQDAQAAKGLWIGTRNFVDNLTTPPTPYPYKVVHVGPRPQGLGEFFPMRFDMISKLQPPVVTVNGNSSSSGKPSGNNFVDPALPCDRMIINEVNTAIGLSMTRKIMAWGQQYHDNYFIYEYTFRNTGNADADTTIEFRNKTLDSVYFYFQYRYAPVRDSRVAIANNTGWGQNTMCDVRGDGLNPSSTFFPGNRDNDVRATYAWHGKWSGFTAYDNIGAPVWTPPTSTANFSDPTDTTGRLAAPHFVGVATIHADRSATDRTNDPNQPSTTSYESSDDNLNRNNSQFEQGKMQGEYLWMQKGHVSPRHADVVGPNGSPDLGTSGGWSNANGYGPYQLRPGDSVKIVMAEASAGLSRAKATSVGERFKRGAKYNIPFPNGINAQQKNDSVYTGRDSLFQTFRRAIASYAANYGIPSAPYPPRNLAVASGADKVSLTWSAYGGGPRVTAWRIYRSVGDYWRKDTLVAEIPASQLSYDDAGVVRGVAYYYYVLAVGDPADNNGAGGTPAGVPLVSSRYFAQTYDPASLQRPAPTEWLPRWRIVPNPYHIGSYLNNTDPNSLRFPGEKDKIAFFDIPGYCTIKIFTELGELINTLEHTNGTGDEYWNSITRDGQVVVSGVYIVVVEDNTTGQRDMQKLVIIR